MLAKRIIPCLDVNHGRVVKGKKFHNLQDVDDPVTLGKYYSESGADELVFYDITATHEGRETFVDTVRAIAEELSIPFTVGGSIICLIFVSCIHWRLIPGCLPVAQVVLFDRICVRGQFVI